MDAGAGFARGISSAISLVQGAASSIASAIRSVLHFSVPDEGPLADADEYGPDFVQLIADGMTSRLDDVKEAARQVAQTTRTSLEGALADADIGLGISKSRAAAAGRRRRRLFEGTGGSAKLSDDPARRLAASLRRRRAWPKRRRRP